MPFAPGQSGNPNGYSGPRNRRRHEVFEIIKGLDHKDALVTLSTLAHESQDEGIKMAAAAALAPYCHPKLQATPTPRFVDNPIDVPDFTHVSDAESFLARLPVLVARGELDFQSAQELCAMTSLWINSQYQREELSLKQLTAGATEHEQCIVISGGLPQLPGCENLIMPQINGHATNGHALTAPADAVPPIESASTSSSEAATPNDSTNG
jgi:hypothetical protein